MSGRVLAGAVLVLLLVVGGIFFLIGSIGGGTPDTGSRGGPAFLPGVHAAADV